MLEVSAGEGWEEWAEVEGFADSTALDKHFVFDRSTRRGRASGRRSGCQDGSVRQYGAVPAKGARCGCARTARAVAAAGNVARGTITVPRSSIRYVSRVVNRRAAAGGVDGETIEEAKVRGPIQMRTRNRAVTAQDYEQLAREAAPEVARVRCVPAGGDDERARPLPPTACVSWSSRPSPATRAAGCVSSS